MAPADDSSRRRAGGGSTSSGSSAADNDEEARLVEQLERLAAADALEHFIVHGALGAADAAARRVKVRLMPAMRSVEEVADFYERSALLRAVVRALARGWRLLAAQPRATTLLDDNGGGGGGGRGVVWRAAMCVGALVAAVDSSRFRVPDSLKLPLHLAGHSRRLGEFLLSDAAGLVAGLAAVAARLASELRDGVAMDPSGDGQVLFAVLCHCGSLTCPVLWRPPAETPAAAAVELRDVRALAEAIHPVSELVMAMVRLQAPAAAAWSVAHLRQALHTAVCCADARLGGWMDAAAPIAVAEMQVLCLANALLFDADTDRGGGGGGSSDDIQRRRRAGQQLLKELGCVNRVGAAMLALRPALGETLPTYYCAALLPLGTQPAHGGGGFEAERLARGGSSRRPLLRALAAGALEVIVSSKSVPACLAVYAMNAMSIAVHCTYGSGGGGGGGGGAALLDLTTRFATSVAPHLLRLPPPTAVDPNGEPTWRLSVTGFAMCLRTLLGAAEDVRATRCALFDASGGSAVPPVLAVLEHALRISARSGVEGITMRNDAQICAAAVTALTRLLLIEIPTHQAPDGRGFSAMGAHQGLIELAQRRGGCPELRSLVGGTLPKLMAAATAWPPPDAGFKPYEQQLCVLTGALAVLGFQASRGAIGSTAAAGARGGSGVGAEAAQPWAFVCARVLVALGVMLQRVLVEDGAGGGAGGARGAAGPLTHVVGALPGIASLLVDVTSSTITTAAASGGSGGGNGGGGGTAAALGREVVALAGALTIDARLSVRGEPAELARRMQQFGEAAAAALPTQALCADPRCDNLAGASDAGLVASGRQKLCAGCRAARFCSRACQLRAWRSGHKDECKRRQREAAAAAAAAAADG